MAYWPFTFRQLVLLGIVALSSSTFVYTLGRGSGLGFALFAALLQFAVLYALVGLSVALLNLRVKDVVDVLKKRPPESKEPEESTQGRRYRRLR
jgi:hypothetical protein